MWVVLSPGLGPRLYETGKVSGTRAFITLCFLVVDVTDQLLKLLPPLLSRDGLSLRVGAKQPSSPQLFPKLGSLSQKKKSNQSLCYRDTSLSPTVPSVSLMTSDVLSENAEVIGKLKESGQWLKYW